MYVYFYQAVTENMPEDYIAFIGYYSKYEEPPTISMLSQNYIGVVYSTKTNDIVELVLAPDNPEPEKTRKKLRSAMKKNPPVFVYEGQ